jgi:hypothetical protein
MIDQPDLDQLAGKLFQVFSRTEYALKASGYNNGNGDAKADWRKFALSVEGLIAEPTTQELKDAIDFFFNAPPKKQVIVDGIIQWEASEPTTDSQADGFFCMFVVYETISFTAENSMGIGLIQNVVSHYCVTASPFSNHA